MFIVDGVKSTGLCDANDLIVHACDVDLERIKLQNNQESFLVNSNYQDREITFKVFIHKTSKKDFYSQYTEFLLFLKRGQDVCLITDQHPGFGFVGNFKSAMISRTVPQFWEIDVIVSVTAKTYLINKGQIPEGITSVKELKSVSEALII